MDGSAAVTVVGGLGLFLLGIHHLTEGLKGLAGDSLRRVLQAMVGGRLSAIVSGALFTVAIQSSTATTLTVIGFVSAGLVTFSQAVGVIIGATFGTTSTPWLVAIFGFRLRIAAFAMPMLGIGAFLWPIAEGKTRSAGAILAGFALLFIGIEYLQRGMEGISWNLDAIGGSGFGWQWILAGIGILMSVVMQSSSAAAATTLVALHAGSLTFQQACAMIVGQSVGTAATSALVAIGAGLAVRRAALAHIVYNVTIGVVGILLLGPITRAADWVGSRLDDPQGVLALAAFSSIFKLVAGCRILPMARWFFPSHREDLWTGYRVGRQPSRTRPSRSRRGCGARGCVAGGLGDSTWVRRCRPPAACGRIRQLRSASRSGPTDRAISGVAFAGDHRSEHNRTPSRPALSCARSPEPAA
jgi:phosphate:Na+ symporter